MTAPLQGPPPAGRVNVICGEKSIVRAAQDRCQEGARKCTDEHKSVTRQEFRIQNRESRKKRRGDNSSARLKTADSGF
jgi:hypothetical protein